MNSGEMWYWMPPPKRTGSTVVKELALRGTGAGERQSPIAEEVARTFGEKLAAMGNAPPTAKLPKASASDIVTVKASGRGLQVVDLVLETNRVTNGL
ncbi:hypothetical protein ERJ75_000509300 [Trypanosoma vivax]|nr:hypothetical protein ERJ75_001182700 [Trypanosoma vivax]KAH8616138.1 hypothetical protein ERJ75_000509300 [Trypanosoma vivax]